MTTLLWSAACLAVIAGVYWLAYSTGHEHGRIDGEIAAKNECNEMLVGLIHQARNVRVVSLAESRRD